jgi:hypothetical protein
MSKEFIGKKLSIDCKVEKAIEMEKENPNSFWVWGSVEIFDTESDVIRIDGMSWERYHRPEEGIFLKVYPSHLHEMADGTPAVVGIVKQIIKTEKEIDGTKYKALKMLVELAVGADGELVELAKIWKNFIFSPQNLVDSVSIGVLVHNGYEMKEGGRDIIQSELYELSITPMPANCQANIKKALNKMFGDKKEIKNMIIEEPIKEEGCGDKPKNEKELEENIMIVLQSLSDKIDNIGKKIDIIIELMPVEDDVDEDSIEKEKAKNDELKKLHNDLKKYFKKE